jgi:hypothetical protein
MISVVVSTNSDNDVEVAYNGNKYTFLLGSVANYLPAAKTLVLEDSTGDKFNFLESQYEFTINNVLWVSTFSALADEFNKNIFQSSPISPIPGASTTIRAALALTGAYVNTTSIQTTGRAQVHFDFTIDDNGATLANSGTVIAIVQVSDDNSTWLDLNNVVAGASLVADGAASAYQAGTVFRQFTAEYAAIAIPYVTGSLPSRAIRISYSTGYGRYYRLALRAADTAGISAAAPGTFPGLEVKASLQ